MPLGKPSSQFEKVDAHHLSETFSDSLGQVMFDGQILRIEFCALRFDEVKPPDQPNAKRYVVARLVMNAEGAVELFNAAHQLGVALKQAGIMKENAPVPQSPGTQTRN